MRSEKIDVSKNIWQINKKDNRSIYITDKLVQAYQD